jgi:hypothetical protein
VAVWRHFYSADKASKASDDLKETKASAGQFKELYAKIFNGKDDKKPDIYPLIDERTGRPQDLPYSLTAAEYLQIRGELRDPAYWCIVWIFTTGEVEVHTTFTESQSRIVFPPVTETTDITQPDPKDPPGTHLLALITSSVPISEAKLKPRLSTMGAPPPSGDRGSKMEKAGGETQQGYVDRLAGQLPSEYRLAHTLFFRTVK